MSDTQPDRNPAGDPPPIEQQREELAETVDALAAKLDVPARVNTAASETAHTAKVKAEENRTALIGVAVAAVLAIGTVIIVRRRRG
ncbi:DUF3618 domain-containing protein [Gordonia rubripertincta]|uniref:DUF3618 domain-containing protein n=2 Tax=Gordonia rubripertincta TaxID=36822 RepID=A0AAW6RDY7_GORRU|nr:DUF3618 domain-containing protein [Gordonia rubripertincta]ASR02114.1 hypothetical protein GCWB2_06490 [Gordonia rubripertincta]MDG6782458.1 DUF3618 domain-containing protein [Gordonia rubripertincta]NKY64558.1 DUF3618 domain-containing protein [Gordonia rubripertincta]QMU22986.1 DUF3618 domain-containing protein [Gordonia rubripertincta]TSD96145.1 DUF3618 domain-containing protein [Gordonia rubripertincta]